MKTIRLFCMLVLFSCAFGTIDALAGNVYGTSAVIYDYANNRTRGYSRTQVDYDTAEYYTAYVCGELYKDGVYQVRACQGGIITATIYTQYTGTSATGSVLSDHYVDMKYFEDEQSSYVDSLGYRFSPGDSYPGDWFFYPADIFGYFNPVSIHLGSTTWIRPRITITNNDFNPPAVTADGQETHNTSTGSADVAADPPCGSPECLMTGDFVVVVLVKNTAGGTWTYKIGDTGSSEQTQLVTLNLGDGVRASWKVTAGTGTPGNMNYNFTIRVSDVRRPNDPSKPPDLSTSTSLVSPTGVILDPTNGGMGKNLHVN